jgi:hypothetical protein
MENPGVYNLGDVALAAINAATVATVVTASNDETGAAVAYIGNLDGMKAATLQGNLTWGSGGTSIKAIWETTLDQGVTWIEVCRMAFGVASEENVVNLSGLTPVGVYTPVALADDAVKDGIFGNRWRVRILTVGVYAGNTSISFRLNAR